ncbi:hypothetical protein C8R47DRAFT_1221896 [Mycena vitilis]|nr:hypothetical protein C8R47DRAFT_1259777 [Mycena vitilis]KAJ6472123.1 hypothetical protein C8R47DRAFT_1221896 [Mycena vitilis]
MDEDIIMLDAPPTPSASVAASKVRTGDDEGMMDLVMVDRTKNDARVVGCNVTIADTSEYPKHHTIISYTDDADPTPHIPAALSALESGRPAPIAETLKRFLLALSGSAKTTTKAAGKTNSLAAVSSPTKGKSFATNNTASDEDEDDGGSDVGYDTYFPDDDDFGMGFGLGGGGGGAGGAGKKAMYEVLGRMQRDFLEVVGTEFDPSKGDFALSISMPVVHLTLHGPRAGARRVGPPAAGGAQCAAVASGGTVYPPLGSGGEYVRKGMALRFQVGVCAAYKPSRAHAVEAGRTFGLVGRDAEDEVRERKEREKRAREAGEWYGEGLEGENGAGDGEEGGFYDGEGGGVNGGEEEEAEGEGGEAGARFERFSLSTALETLLDAQLVKLIALRRAYGVGWAGAEEMYARVEGEQRRAGDVWEMYRNEILRAVSDEAALARSGTLPHDPLRGLPKGEEINVPYTAFCFLVRRLMLCTRYCLVCHNELTAEFEALKPYVCDRPLCTYQCYAHNRRASLEYEIMHNPETVDLLVSLTYSAAAGGVVDEPLPKGMALRVPPPDKARITAAPVNKYQVHMQQAAAAPTTAVNYQVGLDGLVEFDLLPVEHMRASIAGLIDTLPSIDDMKRHLDREVKPGKSKPRLKEMENGTILPAAWSALRWCVASCARRTSRRCRRSSSFRVSVRPSPSPPPSSSSVRAANSRAAADTAWRQFRFSVGAPDAESKFQKALQDATKTDGNARKYPSLYAFHGSALRNWHSIIRHGLWYKTVANGRAFGDGVYLAKEAQTSMGHYAAGGRACWRKSKLGPTSCVALAEVVNLPHRFVSSNPHFWIMCRYLLIKGIEASVTDSSKAKKKTAIPLVKLDPAQAITLMGKSLQVPQPGYQIGELVQQREGELVDEETNVFIFEEKKVPPPVEKGKGKSKGSSFLCTVSSVFKGKGSAAASGFGSSAPAKGPPCTNRIKFLSLATSSRECLGKHAGAPASGSAKEGKRNPDPPGLPMRRTEGALATLMLLRRRSKLRTWTRPLSLLATATPRSEMYQTMFHPKRNGGWTTRSLTRDPDSDGEVDIRNLNRLKTTSPKIDVRPYFDPQALDFRASLAAERAETADFPLVRCCHSFSILT